MVKDHGVTGGCGPRPNTIPLALEGKARGIEGYRIKGWHGTLSRGGLTDRA